MCGISGVVASLDHLARAPLGAMGFEPEAIMTTLLAKAESAQRHRGPDGSDFTVEHVGSYQVGLGHQRLAVIDLSPAGAQPFAGRNGDGLITFNGEIYNYRELRSRLQAAGLEFRTDTDTEVLISALREWGVERALNSFNGMWAFAYLDRRSHRLILARDRVGIKPLYMRLTPERLDFASELKSLLAMNPRRYRLNSSALRAYLQQALLDTSPSSMLQGIVSLEAGCYLTIELDSLKLAATVTRYWTPPLETVETVSSDAQLQEEVRELFFDAVDKRLRSDVPVGVLLSGGVDSSAIACAALGRGVRRREPSRDVTLLAAVSSDPRFDESSHIDVVARYLGHEVHKVPLDLGPDQAFRLLETVTYQNDEPVGSFTSVAHYLLMQAAKEQGATVVLSGQGADELMCGYKKYLGFRLQQLLRSGQPFAALETLFDSWRKGTQLVQFNWAEARRYLPKRNDAPSLLGEALQGYQDVALGLPAGMSMQQRQVLDLVSLSVPQLTHYEDRMSMAHGREVRLPFLDHRLVEKLLALPTDQKLRHGWSKYLFRQAMAGSMPPEIVWRRDKKGFSLPQSEWLRGELRPRVLELFSPDALIFRSGLMNRAALLTTYDRYVAKGESGSGVWYRQIFNPLALEIWLRRFEPYLDLTGSDAGQSSWQDPKLVDGSLPQLIGGLG